MCPSRPLLLLPSGAWTRPQAREGGPADAVGYYQVFYVATAGEPVKGVLCEAAHSAGVLAGPGWVVRLVLMTEDQMRARGALELALRSVREAQEACMEAARFCGRGDPWPLRRLDQASAQSATASLLAAEKNLELALDEVRAVRQS